MVVGATSGNWAIGKLKMLIVPTSKMMMAQTLEKTGRLMKKSTNMAGKKAIGWHRLAQSPADSATLLHIFNNCLTPPWADLQSPRITVLLISLGLP